MITWTKRSWLKIAGTGILAGGVLACGTIGTASKTQVNGLGVNEGSPCQDTPDTIPAEILRQTFQVRVNNRTGTAFTVEVDERQYIVTAQHLLGSANPQAVEMWISADGWRQVPVEIVGIAKPPVDVAVLATNFALGSRSRVSVGVETVDYGQALWFLGYPFGLDFEPVPDFRAAPLPFVKAGILSGLRRVPNEKGLLEFFVDAAGNKGFSGGPLILRRRSANEGGIVTWHVVGVVTSRITHPVPLKNVSGTVVGSVDVDAGILRATSIDAVTRLIRANPVGYPFTD